MSYAITVGDALVTQWLEQLRSQPLYAALHTGLPTTSAPGSSELSSPGYARQQITLTRTGRSLANDAPVTFTGLPAATIGAVALWTSGTGGQLLLAMPTAGPIAVANNQSWTLAANDLAVAF